eukprot:4922704-Amphidinium_carterae.1
MAALSAAIAIRCEQAHVEFTVEHVRLNCEADALSRLAIGAVVPEALKAATRIAPAIRSASWLKSWPCMFKSLRFARFPLPNNVIDVHAPSAEVVELHGRVLLGHEQRLASLPWAWEN